MKLFSSKQTWDTLTRAGAKLSGISDTYVQMKPITFLNDSISRLNTMISIKPEAEEMKKARDVLMDCKSQIINVMQPSVNKISPVEASQSEKPSMNRRT